MNCHGQSEADDLIITDLDNVNKYGVVIYI